MRNNILAHIEWHKQKMKVNLAPQVGVWLHFYRARVDLFATMAKHVPFCFPTSASHPSCAEQNYGGEKKAVVRGTPLAQPAMGRRLNKDVSAAVLGSLRGR